MARTSTKKTAAPKFENRVRFNWGYHDAARAVREGWACKDRNFGFGPALNVKIPADVLYVHADKEYARGWTEGYADATAGTYAGDSTAAWERCLAAGTVAF